MGLGIFGEAVLSLCAKARGFDGAFFKEIGGVEVWKKETRKTRSMRVEKILKKFFGGTGSVGPWIVQRGGVCVVGRMRAVGILRTGGAHPSGDSLDRWSRSLRGRSVDCGSEGPALSVRDLCGGPWIVRRGGVRVAGRMRAVGILRTGGAHPSGLPGQFVDFVLEGPLIGFLTVSMAHGVVADIIPFLVVALAAAEFTIPKMALPEAHFIACDLMPLSAYRAFPIGDPVLE